MRPALALACSVAFAACALPARAAYPVEIDGDMHGLAIETKASAGQPLVVTFASADKAKAVCKATVTNGLESPRSRTVTVKPGKRATISFRLGMEPTRVRIEASCVKAPGRTASS